MEPHTANTTGSAPPAFYEWEADGRPFRINLAFTVVDELGYAVMRGFSAVPRRGAEVGGILLGRVEEGPSPTVWVEAFCQIPCSYANGPSYILTGEEQNVFCEKLDELRAGDDEPIPIGYFRSHTRDPLELLPEDLEVMGNEFPEPTAIVLLIRPFATRTSEAALFFRENGRFPARSYREFPFRRKELGGGKSPKRPRATVPARGELHLDDSDEPSSPRVALPADFPFEGEEETSRPQASAEDLEPAPHQRREAQWKQSPEPAAPPAESAKQKRSKGWVWIPLSFLFLFLGVFVGFQTALSFRGAEPETAFSPYTLDLAAERSGDSIHVRWDRMATAVRTARRGVLTIIDGGVTTRKDLSSNELLTGSVIYRNNSSKIRFELQVFPRESVSVTETLDVDASTVAEKK